MVRMMVAGAVVFLALIVIRKVFRGKVSNVFLYSLWLVFAMQLLFSGVVFVGEDVLGWEGQRVRTPISIMNLVDRFVERGSSVAADANGKENVPVNEQEDFAKDAKDAKEAQKSSVPGMQTAENGEDARNTKNVTDTKSAKAGGIENQGSAKDGDGAQGILGTNAGKETWVACCLFGIWLAGVLLILARQCISMHRFRRFLIENREEWLCMGERLYVAEGIATPLLFRSRGLSTDIYIPKSVAENERLVHHAVLHESTHRRHGDIWWGYVRNLLVALYWFYPPVWLAALLSKRDCEYACDDALLQDMDREEQLAYGNSLLSLVEMGNAGDFFSTATAMKTGKSEMEVRIRMIRNGHGRNKAAVLLILLLLLGSGVVACTDAEKRQDKLENTEAPSQEATEVQKTEEGEVISVREADYKIEDMWGADVPEIYYEDDARVIFAGYFGLFIYDKYEQKIVESLDLKYIGCDYTQGDSYCEINVSKDGGTVYLHISNDENMYQYSVSKGPGTKQLRRVKYNPPEDVYDWIGAKAKGQSGIHCSGATIGDLYYWYAGEDGIEYVPLFYAPYASYKEYRFFQPEDMTDIDNVAFYVNGKEYVIEDAEKLRKMEAYLSNPVKEVKGGSGCPFVNVMYVVSKNGVYGKIYPAMDSCSVFRTKADVSGKDLYYQYDENTNEAFWKLFGIEDITKDVWGEE